MTLEASRIDEGLAAALQSGAIDLALGLIPALNTGFFTQKLFDQDWICIAGPKHPVAVGSLDREAYERHLHIGIVSGTGQQLLERALVELDVKRRVSLRLPGFLGLSAILAASDLIATLPRHIGTALAELGGLRVHECPFPIPGFEVKQHWHARYHNDPANRWLRGVCADLFRA